MNPADLAHAITLKDLSRDPYPIYRHLRAHAPVAWAAHLGMWLVTRYDDVRATLLDHEAFTTVSPQSLIAQTFGENMLASEGERHRLYRSPQVQAAFSPRSIAPYLNARIEARVERLVDAIAGAGRADLRFGLAARLPIVVMLDVFGLPEEDERRFRVWYDSFEAALSNHGADHQVAAAAARNVAAFHEYFQRRVERAHGEGDRSVIALMLEAGLCDADVRRNALIIFFGGISTVEALILNTLWALLQHPEALQAVLADSEIKLTPP